MSIVSLTPEQLAMPLIGGVVIGLAVSMLLLLLGRVFGISGIIGGVLVPVKGDTGWRVAAVCGFVAAGAVMTATWPETMAADTPSDLWVYVVAGLLVGFGTQLGSGCTSGHGVCGISRLSPRSIVATMSFIAAGVATVAVARQFGVLP